MGLENIFQKVDQVVNGYDRVKSEYRFLKGNYDFYKSPAYYNEKRKAEIREKIGFGLFYIFAFIWVLAIVTTIILCVTGNDVVLRMLNL